MEQIASSLPTTPRYLTGVADKIEEKALDNASIPSGAEQESEVRTPMDMVDMDSPKRSGFYSPKRMILRGVIGAAAGAATLALSGGGLLATAAVGACIWGITGFVVGGVIGAMAGKTIDNPAVVGGIGAVTGGGTGAVAGAAKGAVLGGLAGVIGGNPLGGAFVGAILSAIGA